MEKILQHVVGSRLLRILRTLLSGWWFASAYIKSILCFLITYFDINFAGKNPKRPMNLLFERAIVPDATSVGALQADLNGGQKGQSREQTKRVEAV